MCTKNVVFLRIVCTCKVMGDQQTSLHTSTWCSGKLSVMKANSNGQKWKISIVITAEKFYINGHGDVAGFDTKFVREEFGKYKKEQLSSSSNINQASG